MKIDWLNLAIWGAIFAGTVAFWAFIGYLLGAPLGGMVL